MECRLLFGPTERRGAARGRHLRRGAGACLALLCALCVPPINAVRAQSSSVAERHMQQARRAYLQLELERARHHIRAALARCRPGACANPQRASILVLAGVIEHVRDPGGEGALPLFRAAVEADPDVQLERELASPDLDRLLAEAHATTVGGEGRRPDEVGGSVARDADTSLWNRYFVEVGYGLGVGTIATNTWTNALPSGFQAGTDPQADADPTNDSLIAGGTPECERAPERYCVRLRDGRAGVVHGVHAAVGVNLTTRTALSLRVRVAPGAERRRMGNYAVGLRGHYRLAVPRMRGVQVSAFAGFSVGQSPIRPRQRVSEGATSVFRPHVQTGLFGVDLGASVVFRVHRHVGVLLQPSWHLQFPRPSTAFQVALGVELSLGQR